MKKIFKRSLLILFAIIISRLLLYNNAYAKREPGALEDSVDTADIIISGEVIEIKQVFHGVGKYKALS
jgi:hypothetical protein